MKNQKETMLRVNFFRSLLRNRGRAGVPKISSFGAARQRLDRIRVAFKAALLVAHQDIDQEHGQADEQNGQRNHHTSSLRLPDTAWQITPAPNLCYWSKLTNSE